MYSVFLWIPPAVSLSWNKIWREKFCQLFITLPRRFYSSGYVTKLGESKETHFTSYPVSTYVHWQGEEYKENCHMVVNTLQPLFMITETEIASYGVGVERTSSIVSSIYFLYSHFFISWHKHKLNRQEMMMMIVMVECNKQTNERLEDEGGRRRRKVFPIIYSVQYSLQEQERIYTYSVFL